MSRRPVLARPAGLSVAAGASSSRALALLFDRTGSLRLAAGSATKAERGRELDAARRQLDLIRALPTPGARPGAKPAEPPKAPAHGARTI